MNVGNSIPNQLVPILVERGEDRDLKQLPLREALRLAAQHQDDPYYAAFLSQTMQSLGAKHGGRSARRFLLRVLRDKPGVALRDWSGRGWQGYQQPVVHE